MKVAWITIGVNLGLAIFKFTAGILAKSSAIIADAVNSTTDIGGTVIVMIGVKMASKEADNEHQYGHERMESVAALILAVILFSVGLGLGHNGVLKVFGGAHEELPVPGILALVAAVTTLVIKESMYWYTRATAKRIDSVALIAAAWDHRADALASIGCFAGILGARMGYPVLDPVAAVLISLFIIKASYNIFREAIGKMTDKACETGNEEIAAIVMESERVLGIDMIKTRIFGNKIYVDVEIRADGSISLREAHDIAEGVHDAIEERLKNVKHCMVHVNPETSGE